MKQRPGIQCAGSRAHLPFHVRFLPLNWYRGVLELYPRRGLIPLLSVFLLLILALATAPAASEPGRATRVQPAKSVQDPALAKARQRVLGAQPLSLIFYVDDPQGRAALQAHAAAVTVLSPQGFGLDAKGTLRGHVADSALGVAREAGVPLLPLVANPGFDRRTAHLLLHNVAAQERAAQALAARAAAEHYLGWQLDFEGLDPADEPAYTRFVTRVAQLLHRQHRLVSVAVVPRFADNYPSRSPEGFFTGEWGAAYDYRGLGRVCDFVVLMAYDQHTPLTPPGPVAGYDWTKAALLYALDRVPAEKLVLGVPFYGREWDESAQATTAHSLAYADLDQFRQDPASESHWDELGRTPWFERRDGGVRRSAWFDDARSLHEKLKLVETYHLRGYAAWRLGVEDPAFWDPVPE